MIVGLPRKPIKNGGCSEQGYQWGRCKKNLKSLKGSTRDESLKSEIFLKIDGRRNQGSCPR
jgi:hypothetical protein